MPRCSGTPIDSLRQCFLSLGEGRVEAEVHQRSLESFYKQQRKNLGQLSSQTPSKLPFLHVGAFLEEDAVTTLFSSFCPDFPPLLVQPWVKTWLKHFLLRFPSLTKPCLFTSGPHPIRHFSMTSSNSDGWRKTDENDGDGRWCEPAFTSIATVTSSD